MEIMRETSSAASLKRHHPQKANGMQSPKRILKRIEGSVAAALDRI
jgi:hypothetical protein